MNSPTLVALIVVVLLLVVFFSLVLRKRPSKIEPQASTEVTPRLPRPWAQALKSWMPLLRSHSKNQLEWERVLIESDMGPKLAQALLTDLEKSESTPLVFFKERLGEVIRRAEDLSTPWRNKKPWVLFLVGVNGVGKTTTLVKLAHWLQSVEKISSIGAIGADTFRKAAVEQLERGIRRLNLDFFSISGGNVSEGADPAAVVFDGLKKFSPDKEVILVDTSGRLHVKKNLMEELKKIKRVADKAMPGAPHDIWMVVDATLGQNAIQQVREFHQTVRLTGLVLTKMDGLSRGGIIFQLFQDLQIPIRFVGLGEKDTDLEIFHASKFIEDLFDQERASS